MLKEAIASLKQRIERWQSGLETDAAYQKRTGFDPTVRPQYGDVIAYCDHIDVWSGGPIMKSSGGPIGVARHDASSFMNGIEIRVDWIAMCPECAQERTDPGLIQNVRFLKPDLKLNCRRIIWKWPLP